MIFKWLERRRRAALLENPAPPEWAETLSREYELFDRLDAEHQTQLIDIARVLVAEKSWEGARGFEVDDHVQVIVAAQAALLLLGIEHDYYDNIDSVVIYPAGYRIPGGHANAAGVVDASPRAVLGTAHSSGLVVLSWRSARAGGADADDGRNLVYHEFAHALDMLDGVVDGTPVLPDRAAYRTWFEVMTRYYERLVEAAERGRRRTLLDTYGATNVAEFFAVATEAFFEKPRQMRKRLPDLYETMQLFYRQDPAAWR